MLSNIELYEKIRVPNNTVVLDCTNSSHRDLLFSLYGGKESMQNQLPKQYALFEKAKTHFVAKQTNATSDGFNDGVAIEFVTYKIENNLLTVNAVTSLNNNADFIDQHLEIRTAAGEIVDGLSTTQYDTKHADLQLKTEFDFSKFKSKELKIDYVATWFDGTKEMLKAQMASADCHENVYLNTSISSINLVNPIHKKTPANTPIVVCYGRTAAVSETIDYVYQEAICQGKQRLLLDFGANVMFSEPTPNFSHIDMDTFTLKADCGSGIALYRMDYIDAVTQQEVHRKTEIAKRFVKTESGFSFSLAADWGDSVPTAHLPKREPVSLSFKAEYVLSDNSRGQIQIATHLEDDTVPNAKKLPSLLLLWSCLAVGSKILMADGSERKIEDIKIGDKICIDFTFETATVDNVWRGIECDPLIQFKTKEGAILNCTSLHPVATTEGIIAAGKIKKTHFLIDEKGAHCAIDTIGTYPPCEVYNLSLKPDFDYRGMYPTSGTTMICNGLLVGDNEVQNSLDCVALLSSASFNDCSEKDTKETLFAILSRGYKNEH